MTNRFYYKIATMVLFSKISAIHRTKVTNEKALFLMQESNMKGIKIR